MVGSQLKSHGYSVTSFGGSLLPDDFPHHYRE
jgi:hypothetical protein